MTIFTMAGPRAGRRALGAMVGALALMAGGCTTLPASGSAPSQQSAISGQTVTINTADGTASALLFTPAGSGQWPAVVLFSDASGLRPVHADIGERLAQAGYVVLIPNQFYRSVPLDGSAANAAPALPASETFRRGMEWRALAPDAAVIADTRSYFAWLGTQEKVDQSARAGVVGYNVGGSHAFIAARAMPHKIAVVTTAHPSAIATTRDTSPHLFVDQSNAAYLVQIAGPDYEREPQDKPDLEAAFAAAGLSAQVTVASGAQGYAVPDQEGYDPAAEDAFFTAMVALLDETLK